MSNVDFGGKVLDEDPVPTAPDHYSFSQLQTFLKCPQSYYRKYILKEPWASGFGMTTGKAFHIAVESMWKTKSPKSAAKDYDAFWQSVDVSQLLDPPEPEDLGNHKARMLTLADIAYARYSESLPPKEVEHRFEVGIEDFKVVGVMDLVTQDGKVIDWKTGAKPPAQDIATTSRQLTLYDYAFRQEYGQAPSGLGIIWAGYLKAGATFEERWAGVRLQKDFDRLVKAFQALHKAVKNDGPWAPAPDGPGIWWCSEEKCPAWHTCPVRT